MHSADGNKTYPMERVDWLDHFSYAGDEDDTERKTELVLRHSVGFVVHETQDVVVLAACVDENGTHDWTVIGKALIHDREELV